MSIPATLPDGRLAFHQAEGATRLANGNVVISDVFDASVRFFDASGKPLRTVGRRGTGPGEFQAPGWVQQCSADSLFVWDYMQARVTVMDSTGRYAREYRERADTHALSCSRSGAVGGLTTPHEAGPPSAKGEQYTAPLWLSNSVGRIQRNFGRVAFAENRPLGRLTSVAVTNERVYVGTADSAFVDVYAHDGSRMGAFPVGVATRRPTERNYERAIDRMVALAGSPEMRAEHKKQMLRIPMPDRLPAYTAVFADSTGTLWVVASAPGDAETHLRAISGEGHILGDVRVPRELRIFEVGTDYVLGAYEDANGEQHVALYRIRRGA